MEKNSLIKVNENSIIYKIKCFFKKIFAPKVQQVEPQKNPNMYSVPPKANMDNEFWTRIKNTENEHTKLLKLQQKYENGEVLEKDLNNEQVNALSKLYDKQIEKLQKLISIKEKELAKYRINTKATNN